MKIYIIFVFKVFKGIYGCAVVLDCIILHVRSARNCKADKQLKMSIETLTRERLKSRHTCPFLLLRGGFDWWVVCLTLSFCLRPTLRFVLLNYFQEQEHWPYQRRDVLKVLWMKSYGVCVLTAPFPCQLPLLPKTMWYSTVLRKSVIQLVEIVLST